MRLESLPRNKKAAKDALVFWITHSSSSKMVLSLFRDGPEFEQRKKTPFKPTTVRSIPSPFLHSI